MGRPAFFLICTLESLALEPRSSTCFILQLKTHCGIWKVSIFSVTLSCVKSQHVTAACTVGPPCPPIYCERQVVFHSFR